MGKIKSSSSKKARCETCVTADNGVRVPCFDCATPEEWPFDHHAVVRCPAIIPVSPDNVKKIVDQYVQCISQNADDPGRQMIGLLAHCNRRHHWNLDPTWKEFAWNHLQRTWHLPPKDGRGGTSGSNSVVSDDDGSYHDDDDDDFDLDDAPDHFPYQRSFSDPLPSAEEAARLERDDGENLLEEEGFYSSEENDPSSHRVPDSSFSDSCDERCECGRQHFPEKEKEKHIGHGVHMCRDRKGMYAPSRRMVDGKEEIAIWLPEICEQFPTELAQRVMPQSPQYRTVMPEDVVVAEPVVKQIRTSITALDFGLTSKETEGLVKRVAAIMKKARVDDQQTISDMKVLFDDVINNFYDLYCQYTDPVATFDGLKQAAASSSSGSKKKGRRTEAQRAGDRKAATALLEGMHPQADWPQEFVTVMRTISTFLKDKDIEKLQSSLHPETLTPVLTQVYGRFAGEVFANFFCEFIALKMQADPETFGPCESCHRDMNAMQVKIEKLTKDRDQRQLTIDKIKGSEASAVAKLGKTEKKLEKLQKELEEEKRKRQAAERLVKDLEVKGGRVKSLEAELESAVNDQKKTKQELETVREKHRQQAEVIESYEDKQREFMALEVCVKRDSLLGAQVETLRALTAAAAAEELQNAAASNADAAKKKKGKKKKGSSEAAQVHLDPAVVADDAVADAVANLQRAYLDHCEVMHPSGFAAFGEQELLDLAGKVRFDFSALMTHLEQHAPSGHSDNNEVVRSNQYQTVCGKSKDSDESSREKKELARSNTSASLTESNNKAWAAEVKNCFQRTGKAPSHFRIGFPEVRGEDSSGLFMVLEKPAFWFSSVDSTTQEYDDWSDVQFQKFLQKNHAIDDLDLTGRPRIPIREYLRRFGPSVCAAHRLDAETSGLYVVCKDAETEAKLRLNKLNRNWYKEYCVLVHGTVKSGFFGEITKRIVIEKTQTGNVAPGSEYNVNLTCRLLEPCSSKADVKNAKPAQTCFMVQSYHQLKSSPDKKFTLLRVRIHSGITHQIRVHLASALGHAVVSDFKYGNDKDNRFARQFCPRVFLHHAKLKMRDPATDIISEFDSPLPVELQCVLDHAMAPDAAANEQMRKLFTKSDRAKAERMFTFGKNELFASDDNVSLWDGFSEHNCSYNQLETSSFACSTPATARRFSTMPSLPTQPSLSTQTPQTSSSRTLTPENSSNNSNVTPVSSGKGWAAPRTKDQVVESAIVSVTERYCPERLVELPELMRPWGSNIWVYLQVLCSEFGLDPETQYRNELHGVTQPAPGRVRLQQQHPSHSQNRHQQNQQQNNNSSSEKRHGPPPAVPPPPPPVLPSDNYSHQSQSQSQGYGAESHDRLGSAPAYGSRYHKQVSPSTSNAYCDFKSIDVREPFDYDPRYDLPKPPPIPSRSSNIVRPSTAVFGDPPTRSKFTLTKEETPCRYFLRGNCQEGSKCQFSHDVRLMQRPNHY